MESISSNPSCTSVFTVSWEYASILEALSYMDEAHIQDCLVNNYFL